MKKKCKEEYEKWRDDRCRKLKQQHDISFEYTRALLEIAFEFGQGIKNDN